MVGKKKQISVSQRKYFETRIRNACDEQIADIKYVNASKIVEISKREHQIYLKNLKVDTKLKKYVQACKEMKALEDDLIPVVNRIIDAFGPDRLMWGSDSPYQVVLATYEDSISLVRDKLGLSAADKQKILNDTPAKLFFK